MIGPWVAASAAGMEPLGLAARGGPLMDAVAARKRVELDAVRFDPDDAEATGSTVAEFAAPAAPVRLPMLGATANREELLASPAPLSPRAGAGSDRFELIA